jgi:hypothetical protein
MFGWQLHKPWWAFECLHQRIDRQWNILLRSCDIARIGDLRALEFDFLKYHVILEDVGEHSGQMKFVEGGVARRFRLVARALQPFRATLSQIKSDG